MVWTPYFDISPIGPDPAFSGGAWGGSFFLFILYIIPMLDAATLERQSFLMNTATELDDLMQQLNGLVKDTIVLCLRDQGYIGGIIVKEKPLTVQFDDQSCRLIYEHPEGQVIRPCKSNVRRYPNLKINPSSEFRQLREDSWHRLAIRNWSFYEFISN